MKSFKKRAVNLEGFWRLLKINLSFLKMNFIFFNMSNLIFSKYDVLQNLILLLFSFECLVIKICNKQSKFFFHLLYNLECLPMAWETSVQSQVELYQRLKKWYLMTPFLILSIIRYGSRVKWVNPGKRVVPSPTPWCSSY